MSDLEIIREIEKIVSETAGEKIVLEKSEKIYMYSRSYSSDNKDNINGISLGNCNIKDLTKLTQLLKEINGLSYIRLEINKIKDITPLKNLTNLSYLNLYDNEIEDISPLENLKNLTTLFLWKNCIKDVAPLLNLKTLKVLELNDNPINKLPKLITEFPNMDIKWGMWYENYISFYDNPLESPPIEIVKQGKEVIKFWFETDGFKDYISKFEASNYFSIENIHLRDLENRKEIYFLGENGVGKTLLLQAILMGLRGEINEEKILKQLIENQIFIDSSKSKENKTKNNKSSDKQNIKLSINATDLGNINYSFKFPEPEVKYKKTNVFAYGVSRSRKGAQVTDEVGYLSLFDDEVVLTQPENWLKNIKLKYYEYLENKENKENKKEIKEPIKLETVIDLLKSIININSEDNNIDIKVSSENVLFKERGTSLKFNQLSHGFQSTLIWSTDLLSRLVKDQPEVTKTEDFKAIVLVDEIDLLIHPRWAYKLMSRLRVLFPNIQWFISTHSPIITLGASEDAVFYTLYKENGKTKVSEPFTSDTLYTQTLNSFITSPLFGLDSSRPIYYKMTEHDFGGGTHYVYDLIHDEIRKELEKKPLQQPEIREKIQDLLKKLQKEGKL